MKKFKTILGLVLVFVLVAGGVALANTIINNFYGSATITQTDGGMVSEVLGGSSPDKYFQHHFYEGFIEGGQVFDATTSIDNAFAITAAQLCDNKVIHVNSAALAATHVIAASIDITFPATTTLFNACFNNNGDSKTIMFWNGSPTAASTTQMVAGTGGYLMEPDGQNVEIGGGNAALINIQRIDSFRSNGSYIMTVDEIIPG